MNDRRREPKGIPAGGEFAKEAGAVPNADDLDRNDARLELPGCSAVGEGTGGAERTAYGLTC